jgi:hypothetical protein
MAELFSSKVIKTNVKGPQGLIIAGIHGDEYEPVLAVMKLIDQLEDRLLFGKLTLVPIVNKSAYFAAARVGVDKLDLARTCPGNPDGSLTEQVAAEISDWIRKADFLIDMHTGGNLFDISPLSGYMLHRDASVLDKQREMARAFGLPIVWGTSPDLQGRTLSVARDAGVPAIYTEYRGGGYHPDGVQHLVNGCLNVLKFFEMLPGKAFSETPSFFIEDNKPGSGHLQVMHPSPEEGLFMAEVSLGATVFKGDRLGYLIKENGEKGAEILACQSGMVFLIRAVPMANAGDALAGILPIK